MKVTWLVPDVYGFLLDEIRELSPFVSSLRVLSGSPVPEELRRQSSGVEFHECPERRLLPIGACKKIFQDLTAVHGWRRFVASGWHTRKIAGVYNVLVPLETKDPSDVLHSHFAHPGGIGGVNLSSTAQVLTLRGYDVLTTGSYGSLWNPFYRSNLMRSFAKGIPVTCGSRYSAHRARQILGSEADIRCIPQGLPALSFHPAGVHSRITLGIPRDAALLVSVGNLVEVKNPWLMLRAFARLLKSCIRNVFLLICGDGPLAADLKNLAESLGITDRIRFLGRLPRGELTDIFEISDVLVHTSMSEGFGNVIPEAMLHRLVVVASPVGVAPELIRHGQNGFLPELGDVQSWVHSLKQAISQLGEIDAALEENRETVLNKHSMDKRIKEFLRVYRDAVAIKKLRHGDR